MSAVPAPVKTISFEPTEFGLPSSRFINSDGSPLSFPTTCKLISDRTPPLGAL